MEHIEGKVAFVSGGVSGLGLGLARAFVEAGMKVVITYMRESHRDEALAGLGALADRVHAIRLDVMDREAYARARDETLRVFGKLHVLCNNAGVNQFGPMDEATFEDWDWILGVNLHGVINGLVTLVPAIKAHGEGGHVVNVASMSTFLPRSACGIYTTSKSALFGLSESLCECLAPHGIGVSMYSPGLIRSNINDSMVNRPVRLANTAFHLPAEQSQKLAAIHARGMDPLEAGRAVLEGIRRNRLHIFTHPGYDAELRARFESLLAAQPRRRLDLPVVPRSSPEGIVWDDPLPGESCR